MQISHKNATIYISEICNCKCRSCGVWRNSTPGEYHTARWKGVLRELNRIGVSYLGFSGGEPLLRTDLCELIKTAKEIGFRFVDLCTNGILLNPGTISQFVDAGLDRVIVSLDGIGTVHDRLRGVPGNYEVVLKAVGDIARSPLSGIIQTSLVRQNLHQIPEIIGIARKHRMLWGVNIINDTQYYFRNIAKDSLLAFDSDEISRLIDSLACELNPGDNTVLLKKEYLPILQKILQNGQVPAEISCMVGSHSIYLNADMDVFTGCTALKPVGNALVLSIEDIVASRAFTRQVQAMAGRQCPGCTCGLWQNVENYLQSMPGEKSIDVQ